MKHIVMLAAENDALINGKVGGLADVIRDLPNTLADYELRVTVITPAYGILHKNNPSKFVSRVSFPFGGKISEGELWEVMPKNKKNNVTHFVFEHPGIRGAPIYSNDPPGQPFAQDATKFAIFCSAIGQYLKTVQPSPIIHLHDWHTGVMFLLKELHPEFTHLKNLKHVFTIHNLNYHGNRPIRGMNASIETWFPELFQKTSWIDKWKDTRYKEPQFTPLAAGIKYAYKVNTVSPSYAEEILKPSDRENGFYGGEGLEEFLWQAKKENRFFGILNGIEYSSTDAIPRMTFRELCTLMITEVKKENDKNPESLFSEVISRLEKFRTTQSDILLASVTRITEQKVRLLFESGADSKTALEKLLDILKQINGFYVLLGNGTKEYEEKCIKIFKQYERLIYIKLYSLPLAQALYANGTLFIMPSSFEPCGISQMIAMREGQPCVVHAVGGLKDTVIDMVNGFTFSGRNIQEQVDNFVTTTKKILSIYLNEKEQWKKIRMEAMRSRFEWKDSAKKYIESLYN